MRLEIRKIRVVGYSCRDLADIEALAKSIAQVGLLQPLVVTREHVLLGGEARLMACLLLGWKDVYVKKVDFEDYLQQLLEEGAKNRSKEGFTSRELAALARKVEAVAEERARGQVGRAAGGRRSKGRSGITLKFCQGE